MTKFAQKIAQLNWQLNYIETGWLAGEYIKEFLQKLNELSRMVEVEKERKDVDNLYERLQVYLYLMGDENAQEEGKCYV